MTRLQSQLASLVIQGAQGRQGFVGAQGVQGATGAQGVLGAQGVQGATGSPGAQGVQGATGSPGAQGVQGATGPTGPQGVQGVLGAQGVQGATGAQGAQGAVGAQGVQGTIGAQGVLGAQGVQGATGSPGAQGVQGAIGAQGATGPQGVQGAVGAQGVQGATGPVAGSANQVVYKDGSNNAAGSANFTFDGTNLILGAANPSFQGSSSTGSASLLNNSGGAFVTVYGGSHATRANYTDFINASSTSTFTSGGYLGVGTNSPAVALHVSASVTNTGGTGTEILRVANLRVNTGSSGAAISFVTNEISGSTQYTRAQITGEYDGAYNINGRLLFATTNTSGNLIERMRLDSAGDLGIGTTDPLDKLHIDNGTLRISGTTAQAIYLYGAPTVKPYITLNEYGVTNNYIGAGSTTSGVLSINGSLASTTGLHVKASTGYVGIGVVPTTLGNLEIQANGTGPALWVQTGGTTSASVIAEFRTGSNNPALTIYGNGVVESQGTVGIGTATPYSPLSITQARQGNDVDKGAALLMSTATTASDRLNLNFSMNGVSNRVRAAIGAVALDSSGGYSCGLAFYTRNAPDGSALATTDEKMRIGANGFVGIGIGDPNAKLEIYNTRTSGTNVTSLILSDSVSGLQTSGFGTQIRGLSNGGAAVSAIGFEAYGGTNNDTAIAFYTQSTAGALTRRVTISAQGNVGVATASPQGRVNIVCIGSTLGLTGDAGLRIQPSGTGSTDQIVFGYSEEAGYSSGVIGYVATNTASFQSGDLLFATRSVTTNTAPTERMRITSDGSVAITQTPGKYTIDVTGGATSIANGGTVDFPSASGMLVVNNWTDGGVTIYLCGGGSTKAVADVAVTQTGTLAYNGAVSGYRWTNTYGSTATFGFFFVRTRNTA